MNSRDQGRARRLLPSMSQLAAFEAVCRTGSTQSAAVDLSLTARAVSKLIQSPRRPDRRGAVPARGALAATGSGGDLGHDVGRALDLVSRGALRVRSTTGGGRWRLAVPQLPAPAGRACARRGFLAAHPGVTVNMGTRLLNPSTSRGKASMPRSITGPRPGLEAEHLKLFDERLLVIGSRLPPGGPEALARQPLLQLETCPEARADWSAARGLGGAQRLGMVFDQFAPMIEAAAHGSGRGPRAGVPRAERPRRRPPHRADRSRSRLGGLLPRLAARP